MATDEREINFKKKYFVHRFSIIILSDYNREIINNNLIINLSISIDKVLKKSIKSLSVNVKFFRTHEFEDTVERGKKKFQKKKKF